MKHFAYFISGVLVASFVQLGIPAAKAWSLQEQVKKDRAKYQLYLDCRDKEKTKYATYECLRLNNLGFEQL
jgi:hypothetical protein